MCKPSQGATKKDSPDLTPNPIGKNQKWNRTPSKKTQKGKEAQKKVGIEKGEGTWANAFGGRKGEGVRLPRRRKVKGERGREGIPGTPQDCQGEKKGGKSSRKGGGQKKREQK